MTAAARHVFPERGVEDVTTPEIAELADIGTGTLFPYVKTKGEPLLLVQNAAYAEALERGRPRLGGRSTAPGAGPAGCDEGASSASEVKSPWKWHSDSAPS